jgi:hypothetical protein
LTKARIASLISNFHEIFKHFSLKKILCSGNLIFKQKLEERRADVSGRTGGPTKAMQGVLKGQGAASNSGRRYGARGTRFQHDVSQVVGSRGEEISSFRRFQCNRSLGPNLKEI